MKKIGTIKIGKNIQQIRKSFGYTQERLAEEIDCSTRYISDIEQNKSNPSYEVLISICNVFNIGINQIFEGYLNVENDKRTDYTLVGFKNLSEENKKTIKYLISFFNSENNK